MQGICVVVLRPQFAQRYQAVLSNVELTAFGPAFLGGAEWRVWPAGMRGPLSGVARIECRTPGPAETLG